MPIKTLTVGEIKQLLNGHSDDPEFAFSHPSGDHWRSILAIGISEVNLEYIQKSEYHQGFIVLGEYDDLETAEEPEQVLIFS